MEKQTFTTIKLNIEEKVGTITLARPDIRNAFNNQMIDELLEALKILSEQDQIRVLVITGQGKAFCAGADLSYMSQMKDNTYDQNLDGALKMAEVMHNLYRFKHPTVAIVNGATIGGGVGLVAACDIVVAAHLSEFSFSEVKIGLVPAVISPFVIKKVGEANTRYLFLSGERISADRAREYGLVTEVVTRELLNSRVEQILRMLMSSGPQALSAVKELIHRVSDITLSDSTSFTAELIAKLRVSEEGQEGMNAFFEKRRPNWAKWH